MVPFNVNVGGQKVGITFESLVWFFIVTAAATAVGSLFYTNYLSVYFPAVIPPATKNNSPVTVTPKPTV